MGANSSNLIKSKQMTSSEFFSVFPIRGFEHVNCGVHLHT